MSTPMLPSSSLPSAPSAGAFDALGTPVRLNKTSSSAQSTPLPFFARRDPPSATSERILPRDRVEHGLSHSRSLSHANVDANANAIASLDRREILADMDIPRRTTSLRRKPVPGYLPMPNATVPSTHPFAGLSGQVTPHSMEERADEDLFWRAPRSGPLPPRRAGMDSPQSMRTDRDESLRQREEAIRAREEQLRQREEMLAREEALRQREEELRRREEALRIREYASSPAPALSVDGHGTASTRASRRLESPLAMNDPSLFRPLPPVPDPSRPDLNASAESFPSPVTPSTTYTAPSKKLHLFGKKSRKETISSPITHISSPYTGTPPSAARPVPKPEPEPFSVDGKPSQANILEASTLFLRDEDGKLVCFGDLFPHPDSSSPPLPGDIPAGTENETLPPITKTVFFFIRHFWCGQCQDYTLASLALLDPVSVRRAGVRIVVISNGSWKIIKAYRRVLRCVFPVYVDGPRRLYQLFGMTKMTNDFGPLFKGRAAYHQRSVPGQLLHGSANAILKFPMADPGKLTQLGGEFVFSKGYTCDFVHRMTTTSDHMEAPDVVKIAGVAAPTIPGAKWFEIEDSEREELNRMAADMERWREERDKEVHRIRRYKAERRGLKYDPTEEYRPGAIDYPSDEDAIDPWTQAAEEKAQGGEAGLGHDEPATPITVDTEMAAQIEQVRIVSDRLEREETAAGSKGDENGLIVSVEK